jgi:hypothetical protein
MNTNTVIMVPVATIPTIITSHTMVLFMAPLSVSDSVFGIPFGIMASSDPITGDIHPIIMDTHPIIGEVTIRITMGAVMGAAVIHPTVQTTDIISGKAS